MAAQGETVSLSHYEPLQRLSITTTGIDGSRKIGAAAPVDMRFDALGRKFDLQLSPNSRLLDAAREIPGNSVVPYRGALAGIENSWVRIVMSDGMPSGMIWDGNELFAIERAGDNIAGADATIIYRLADAFVAPGSMTCGAGGSLTNGNAIYKALTAELEATMAEAAVADKIIEIGLVGDAARAPSRTRSQTRWTPAPCSMRLPSSATASPTRTLRASRTSGPVRTSKATVATTRPSASRTRARSAASASAPA
jgi:hypothetical protein